MFKSSAAVSNHDECPNPVVINDKESNCTSLNGEKNGKRGRTKSVRSKDECDSNKANSPGDVEKSPVSVKEKNKVIDEFRKCDALNQSAPYLFSKCATDARNLVKVSGEFKVNMEKVIEILSSKIKNNEVIQF